MNEDRIRRRLREVEDPALGEDIISLDLVRDITIEDGMAQIELAFNAPLSSDELEMGDAIRESLADVDVEPVLYAPIERRTDHLTEVRNIIAVTSGKGGVGKSTVAANLAAGLAELGADVGLLDGDIYGPNAPHLFGENVEPEKTEDGLPIPNTIQGVDVMSPGFVIPDEEAAALRGPMQNRAFQELIEDVEWGKQDYLVIDLPPGTGDIKMTLLQTVPVSGVVGVTTPQGMATDDAIKGLSMFDEHDVPVLGIVENMAMFQCPSCEDTHEIFGEGGGNKLADVTGAPLLEQIPIDPTVSDLEGPEDLAVHEGGIAGEAFVSLAGSVANRVGEEYRKREADQAVLMTDNAGPSDDWL